jgi:hypothetical protein
VIRFADELRPCTINFGNALGFRHALIHAWLSTAVSDVRRISRVSPVEANRRPP